jgi:lipoate-protein ligase B
MGSGTQKRLVEVQDLGLIDYSKAFQTQCRSVEEVNQGGPERLILCEHPPVLTLGRSTWEGNILISLENLAQRGIEVIPVNRGGDVTLHAPGQLVAYPIIDLKRGNKDLKKYLYKLEQVAIDLLRDFDIMTRRVPGSTGVWSGEEKIVSIGVGVRHWVTFHGVGLNISTDLSLFSLIRPCGMDVHMTSMENITGRSVDQDQVKQRFIQVFTRCFQLEYKDSQ